jgi:hypothetical protein
VGRRGEAVRGKPRYFLSLAKRIRREIKRGRGLSFVLRFDLLKGTDLPASFRRLLDAARLEGGEHAIQSGSLIRIIEEATNCQRDPKD